jgi:hypothetical protein
MGWQDDGIHLAWAAAARPIRVLRATDGVHYAPTSDWLTTAAWVDPAAVPSHANWYRLQARLDEGETSADAAAVLQIAGRDMPPCPPQIAQDARGVSGLGWDPSGRAVNIPWLPVPKGVEVQVERRVGEGGFLPVSPWVDGAVGTWADKAAPRDTSVAYRLRGRWPGGRASPGEPAQGIVEPIDTPPEAAVWISANWTDSGVALSWSDPLRPELVWRVERSDDGGSTWAVVTRAQPCHPSGTKEFCGAVDARADSKRAHVYRAVARTPGGVEAAERPTVQVPPRG